VTCYDCALAGEGRPAVAVCVGCGAAVCLDHSHTEAVWLTRTEAINRQVAVEPPARAVRCTVCAAAHAAATGNGYERGRRPAGARR
jgi:hypothetical protein